MLEIVCSYCGPRVVGEFAYVGEVVSRPAPSTVDLISWRRYLYDHRNSPGATTERWTHSSGCGQTVTLTRHQTTNEFLPMSTTEEA